ncbi:MAG: hypothetical protein H7831_17955 [Magnetococcus sp. WYHC-3]
MMKNYALEKNPERHLLFFAIGSSILLAVVLFIIMGSVKFSNELKETISKPNTVEVNQVANDFASMKLHQVIRLDFNTRVIRVPTGWVYCVTYLNNGVAATYVPKPGPPIH